MTEQTLEKLRILTESAKYDVSCSSSGTVRSNRKANGEACGVGNTVGGIGICHSFAEDGRCISLLKIMLTNHCIYDCAYCINRRTNDIRRATLSVTELVELTMEFYRRNYIEGLFLSSGVVYFTRSSAICTAFRAAPLSSWSPETKISNPFLSLRDMS